MNLDFMGFIINGKTRFKRRGTPYFECFTPFVVEDITLRRWFYICGSVIEFPLFSPFFEDHHK